MSGERSDEFFGCPHCGADVLVTAKFCRECGADERSGWSDHDDAYDDGGEDDEFDYDEFVRREFPDQAEPAQKNLLLILLIVILCLGMLGFIF